MGLNHVNYRRGPRTRSFGEEYGAVFNTYGLCDLGNLLETASFVET